MRNRTISITPAQGRLLELRIAPGVRLRGVVGRAKARVFMRNSSFRRHTATLCGHFALPERPRV